MRRSIPAAIAVAAILVTAGRPVRGQDAAAEDIARHVTLLKSPGPDDRKIADAWVQRHGDRAVRILIGRLESPDGAVRLEAARALRIVISPFARGLEAAKNHKGFVDLALSRRPVERPWLHARAGEVRRAAMDGLARLLDGIERPIRNAKNPGWPGWPVLEETTALSALAAEVANGGTVEALVDRIAAEQNTHLLSPLLVAAELAMGVPATWRPGGICGNSSAEEFAAFAAMQRRSATEARARLTALHTAWRALDDPARVRFAVEKWAAERAAGTGLDVGAMAPLVRLGSPALGAIRARRDGADSLLAGAAWELASATITGVVDKGLVRKLVAGDDREKIAACRIIAAAGSQSWSETLDRLQSAGDPVCHAASRALAACHRLDAIPRLRKAHTADPANYTAGHAVQELQAWGQ